MTATLPRGDSDHDAVIGHYALDTGRKYAAWQLHATRGMAAEPARRFQPYIGARDTLLDFGCGGGGILANLRCGRRIGVEINVHSREVARREGIEVYGLLSEVPEQTADVVISHHALEHCPRPLDELRGMRRVLRPGGRLVLILPIDDWRTQRCYNPADRNHHLYAWTPLLLGTLLGEAGFTPQRIDVITHAWPPGVFLLWRVLPRPVFDAVCAVWSALQRRRQLLAVAVRPS